MTPFPLTAGQRFHGLAKISRSQTLKISAESLQLVKSKCCLVFLLISLVIANDGYAADMRLIEPSFDPEIAARGFTGVSSCSESSCLDYNPALLTSENEQVSVSFQLGARFNEALFDTIDNWQATKDVLGSDRYREILLKTWNFLSRQTAKADISLGIRLKGFALSYSPANVGALLLGHDPVLPFGDLYTYSTQSLRLGYGHQLTRKFHGLRLVRVGASLKLSSGQTDRFIFNQFNNQYDPVLSEGGEWVTARLGASTQLETSREITLSATVSGIPLYKRVLENLPSPDYLDVQPAVSVELGRWWWGNAVGYYSLLRLTRNENFWLKNRAGIETRFGRLKAGVGISDLFATYGLSLKLPLFTFSFASYGVEYSKLARNVSDRVYWFGLEI
jgi:hypothetical protein